MNEIYTERNTEWWAPATVETCPNCLTDNAELDDFGFCTWCREQVA